MKELNILVLGVGGNVSQGILKALANSQIKANIIGACISEKSLGLYMCHKGYISPYANEDGFIPWLVNICNKEDVDIVLTGVEENIIAIQSQIDIFSKSTKAIFIATELNNLLIGQDKYKTCEWLKKNDCNYPRYCLLSSEDDVLSFVNKVGFPLIAKPRNGKSSNGVYKIISHEQLQGLSHLNNYVLEECIGTDDDEYTVGCYVDKGGELKDIIIMHRKLEHGSTAWAEVVDNDKIYNEAQKICKKFNPKGPLNIQMRVDNNGNPICFELNVRFSGTTPIRAHFGFRDVEAMVREYVLNEPIDICFDKKYGEVYRYVNEMYMDIGASRVIADTGYEEDMTKYNVKIENMGN